MVRPNGIAAVEAGGAGVSGAGMIELCEDDEADMISERKQHREIARNEFFFARE